MYPTKKEESIKDLRGLQNFVDYDGPLKDAVEIARHYGFNLIEPVKFSRRLPSVLTENQKERARKKDLSVFPPGRMAILKKYLDENMDKWPQPVLLSHISEGDTPGTQELRLDVLGTSKSLAEALVIKAGTAILNSWGHKNIVIHINSVGDRDSATSFERELHDYYKKNINSLAGCCRQQMKKAVIGVLECENEKCQLIKEGAPKSLNFLSESGRRHLAEIVESLENMGMNYRINHNLVGHHYCYPKTVFHVKEEIESGEETFLAKGERHDYLSKEIGVGKKVPLISLALKLKSDMRRKDKYSLVETFPHPKIYFAHIGYAARLKSLSVMEILRELNLPVKYLVGIDSISRQLRQAEAEKASHVIILGQKEVLEDSIIWRDLETRYQESVPICKLGEYVKSLKKAHLI